MTLQFADRVMETFTTTGTGTISLAGAVTGYQAFSAVCSNGDTAYYAASDASGNWEVGLGTFTTSGDTLARTTIIASSNSNAAVSWSAGSKTIWLTAPATLQKSGVTGASDVWIATQTASNTPNIQFTNIPAGYDHYIVRYTNILPANNATEFNVNVSTNNGSSYDTGSSYNNGNAYFGSSSGTVSSQGGSITAWSLGDNVANSDSDGISGVATIMGTAGNNKHLVWQATGIVSGGSFQAYVGSGRYFGSASAINALQFSFASGNIASGKLPLYGIRNS